MTTTETMTIRKALRTRKDLDSKIADLQTCKYSAVYRLDRPLIAGVEAKKVEDMIKANWQKLQALMMRREAVNKAIMDANAVELIEVRKFITFTALDSDESQVEKISLANAINRKAYYKDQVVRLRNMLKDEQRVVARYDEEVQQCNIDAERTIRNRKEALPNNANSLDYAKFAKIYADEVSKRIEETKPVYLNPVNSVESLTAAIAVINDYILTIDNELSNKTETTVITVTY